MEFNFQKMNIKESEIRHQRCKEWRSKKELENYLMEKNRDEIIGWVSWKTMKKWGEEIDWHQQNEEDMFIYQKGKNYFYLTFRKYF